MNYEWDENKRIANAVKHNVDFLDAERFDWSSAIETIDNRADYKEKRWIALGLSTIVSMSLCILCVGIISA